MTEIFKSIIYIIDWYSSKTGNSPVFEKSSLAINDKRVYVFAVCLKSYHQGFYVGVSLTVCHIHK